MPSTSSSALSLSTQTRRPVGVDAAQLLRDIRETSTNPIELFRLCLDAQHLLAQAHSVSAGGAA